MRGNPQVASLRPRAVAPARRWSAWLAQAQENRRTARLERVEVIARVQADARRARQRGEYRPELRPWR